MKKWGYLLALLILLQTLSTILYLRKAGQFGFPLDDAWIHQTYARNLGLHGVMAFFPGQPSTGSTSFGWTVLLAAGYLLRIPYFLWTYFLGGLFAIATAFTAAYLSQIYFGNFKNAMIVAVICILEWHLAWASVSGMEIGLFTFLSLVFFLLLLQKVSPLIMGGLVGIIVLVRPEGILLAIIYGLSVIFTQPREMKRLLLEIVVFLLAFSIIISPWILFNYMYSHRPFPNTISAKFMQYGYPWSLWKSLKYPWDVLLYFLNGPLLLLVPSAGFSIYKAFRMKSIPQLYTWMWALTLVGLYAVALPTIYDQGRYLMPLIPLVIIYGVEELTHLLTNLVQSFLLRQVIWLALFGMVILLWINGASDYAYRIQLFNRVHMQAAKWINTNLSQDAVLATHDIGILGYHTGRQIVDLAGLVTPEIVPVMRDPQKMADYLRQEQVTYVLVYSSFYRQLLNLLNAHVVFSPGAEELRAMGVEPFEIHKISEK